VNGFIGQLKIRAFSPEEVAAADGGSAALYQLLEDFGYHSDAFGTFMAPAGMITDFASIPRPRCGSSTTIRRGFFSRP
jgi:hypothetical protein